MTLNSLLLTFNIRLSETASSIVSAPSTIQFLLPRKSIETNDFQPSTFNTFDKSGHDRRDRVSRQNHRAPARAVCAQVLSVVHRGLVGDYHFGSRLLGDETVAATLRALPSHKTTCSTFEDTSRKKMRAPPRKYGRIMQPICINFALKVNFCAKFLQMCIFCCTFVG